MSTMELLKLMMAFSGGFAEAMLPMNWRCRK